MKEKIFRKIIVLNIILLLIGISSVPIVGSLSLQDKVTTQKININLCDPPVILDCYWELTGSKQEGWILTVTADCYDETSGMNRVEFHLDEDLMHVDYGPTSPYEWILEDPFNIPDWKNKIITVTAFDNAGNSDFVIFECKEIKSKFHIRSLNMLLSNIPIFQILIRFLRI